MKTGKIIRIFSARQAVINLGAADGVEKGTRFGIFTPATEIIDSENGERLGEYRQRKAIVRAAEVFERFSVVEPPPRREQIDEPIGGPVGAWLQNSMRTRVVAGKLAIDSHDADPLPTGSHVQTGDLVEVFPQDDPARAEPEATGESASD